MGGRKYAEMAQKWLEDTGNAPYTSPRLSNLSVTGIQVVIAQSSRFICNFRVPKNLTDRDGNWRAGAIATLIDNVGSMAIASATGWIKVSVDFDISYFSTAKIDEEVEIEAKNLGHIGKVSSVIVEVRKKESGELVALGKQWMAAISGGQSKL